MIIHDDLKEMAILLLLGMLAVKSCIWILFNLPRLVNSLIAVICS